MTASRAVFGDGKNSRNDVPPANLSLAAGHLWLMGRINEGVKCPCCRQFAKVYRRKLNTGMAISLIRMFRAGGADEYVNVTKVCIGGTREEGKLRFWGLVEEAVTLRDDGGRAGWWRITPDGALFVRGLTTVPSHVLLYDNHFRGFDGPLVTIQDCLGDAFDLAELLS